MKFITLERKARAAIKNRPEFRRLERKKMSIEKSLAGGKVSKSQAGVLRKLIGLRRRRLVNREIHGLLCASASA